MVHQLQTTKTIGARGHSIGRITTGGKVTIYTDTGIKGPFGITAGPDGAMWFTDNGKHGGGDSIGRIATRSTPER